jgi:hypothetical protein
MLLCREAELTKSKKRVHLITLSHRFTLSSAYVLRLLVHEMSKTITSKHNKAAVASLAE